MIDKTERPKVRKIQTCLAKNAVALIENLKITMGMKDAHARRIVHECILFTAMNYEKVKQMEKGGE